MKMISRILFLIALLAGFLFSPNLFANDSKTNTPLSLPFPNASNSDNLGVYFGIGIGANIFSPDVVSTNSIALPGNAFFASSQFHFSPDDTQAMGDLLLGYGQAWSRFYLAGEFDADFTSNRLAARNFLNTNFNDSFGDVININGVDSIKFKLSPGIFSLVLRPGILIASHNLLYGIVGGSVSYLQTTLNSNFLVNITTAGTTFTVPVNVTALDVNKTIYGWRAGLGLETAIAKLLSLRLEYIYAQFQKVNYTISPRGIGNNVAVIRKSISIRPESQSILFKLVYHI